MHTLYWYVSTWKWITNPLLVHMLCWFGKCFPSFSLHVLSHYAPQLVGLVSWPERTDIVDHVFYCFHCNQVTICSYKGKRWKQKVDKYHVVLVDTPWKSWHCCIKTTFIITRLSLATHLCIQAPEAGFLARQSTWAPCICVRQKGERNTVTSRLGQNDRCKKHLQGPFLLKCSHYPYP